MSKIDTPRRRYIAELQDLAKSYVPEFTTTLDPDDLSELILLIHYDWPTSENKKQMLEHLQGLSCTLPIERINIKDFPKFLPLPRPFHTRENSTLLLSKIRRNMTDKLKKNNLKHYLFVKEDELLLEILAKGLDDAVFLDVPPYVSHSLIRRALRSKLLEVLEGRHPRIRIQERAA